MNQPDLRITILVENTAGVPGVLAEHGFACWIEMGTRKILFDTGQTNAVVQNAEKLGIDLRGTDSIVLSHGHYDHTGGLEAILAMVPRAQLLAHPAAFSPKYSKGADGSARSIGSPYLPHRNHFVKTLQFTRVTPDIHVTGEIRRTEEREMSPTKFYIDPDAQHPDPLIDDQALLINASQGTVVVLGCAHAGVINTLKHVLRKAAAGDHIHAVIGGMHLVDADTCRIDWTIRRLAEFGIQYIAPAHCTGEQATTALQQCFPKQFRSCSAGSVHEF